MLCHQLLHYADVEHLLGEAALSECTSDFWIGFLMGFGMLLAIVVGLAWSDE